MNTQTDYQAQAQEFATANGLTLKTGTPKYGKFFPDDEVSRFVFPCTLERGGKSYRFKFGQSIAQEDTPPTLYDILSCLTKYDPHTFENFCADYGYNTDSRKAEKTYKAVVKEWKQVKALFSDVLDELREIQ